MIDHRRHIQNKLNKDRNKRMTFVCEKKTDTHTGFDAIGHQKPGKPGALKVN